MKIFSIVGLALVANSMLANGLAIKGSNAPRLSVQSQAQETLLPANLADTQQEEQPTPYQFSFDTNSEGSSSSRQETGDGSGKVFGQYSIKGSDGISRVVSYTADSEGFRANITTNEPGTESQNPSFVVLQSSQLPAAEISRQLQTEADLAQQEEQASEEQAELPQKSVGAPPRKSLAKSNVSRRPVQASAASPQRPVQQQQAQVSVPVKSRRPAQQSQQVSAPSKRLSASSSKGAVRSRGPSKSVSSTTQRPKVLASAKRPVQQQQQQQQAQEEEQEAPALNLAAEQNEEAVAEEEPQEF